MAEILKIGLAGNPNCGKTTLFNQLTGSNQYVGNWPGVTVEKKDGQLKGHEHVILQDLPGIYSLSPYSLEEVVTRNYLLNDRPNALINIVDGTNIERNLYLTTQLLELNMPMIVAINMMDLVSRNGDKFNPELLAKELGCPVIPISALTGEGTDKLIETAIELASKHHVGERPHIYTGGVEHAIAHIEASIQDSVPEQYLRWYAVKIFERDEKVLKDLALSAEMLSHLEKHIVDCEQELDDEADGIITNQRYASIAKFIAEALEKKNTSGGLTTSDKIDMVVTSRVFALPIFALLIWLMYYLSVTTWGAYLTSWASHGVFGDGWFLPFMGSDYRANLQTYEDAEYTAAPLVFEDFSNSSSEEIRQAVADYMRFSDPEQISEEAFKHFLDDHGFVGIACHSQTEDVPPAFAHGVSAADVEAAKTLRSAGAPRPEDYSGWIRGVPRITQSLLDRFNVGNVVRSLVMDGIIGGVGTVLGFLPQLLLVFFFLAFLEDCGYMSRVAFIMDRLFRRFGLSGKSFIPMIVGAGCSVPGIMAARTIENEKDRRMTIMLSTFIPCGAKMEIVAMITLACFPGSIWVAPGMYFIGVLIIVLAGIALKKTHFFAGEPAPFVMELPAYHLPTAKNLLLHTWDRGKDFCVKAGTVIFVACVILWSLQAFSWKLTFVGSDVDNSILASIGNLIAWIFAPLGFGNWKGAVAVLSAEIAKEQATGTLGVLAHSGQTNIVDVIRSMFQEFNPAHPNMAALSFLLVNLFAPPCLGAIITAFREMGSVKWGWLSIAIQLYIGYTIALVAYQLGVYFFDGGSFGIGTIFALLLCAVALFMVFRPARSHAGD
ncbi:MAG: ferrous iron transporter B [Lentisphaeria bacterium]|nr:ferrous iron transporter B [Lentisphaeria bacterium]